MTLVIIRGLNREVADETAESMAPSTGRKVLFMAKDMVTVGSYLFIYEFDSVDLLGMVPIGYLDEFNSNARHEAVYQPGE